MELAGRVAVITGAGRGIGRAIAIGFAREGAEVVAVSRTLAEVEAVAVGIRAAGGRAVARQLDVGDEDDVAALATWLEREYGRLHVVVNNAALRMIHVGGPHAVHPYRVPLLDLRVDEWDAMVRVNLRGPFLVCRLLGRLLAAAGRDGGAAVVNVSAGAGIRGQAGRAPYSATKFALEGLTQSLAAEWTGLNIAVNTLEPGVSVLTDDQKRDPNGRALRFAAPEVMVPAAVFLATQDASGVTGRHLNASAWLEERGLGVPSADRAARTGPDRR